MQTIAEVLKKIEDYSISNQAESKAFSVKRTMSRADTIQTNKAEVAI